MQASSGYADLLSVYEQLETAMGEVHKGDLTAASGSAMASMARALCAVMQLGEMEERLRDIEERFG